jgi:hypothetical protein
MLYTEVKDGIQPGIGYPHRTEGGGKINTEIGPDNKLDSGAYIHIIALLKCCRITDLASEYSLGNPTNKSTFEAWNACP